METLLAKLARQIERVTDLRAQYRTIGQVHGAQVNVAPAILMMTNSINQAIAAIGSSDIQEQIAATLDLKGYSA